MAKENYGLEKEYPEEREITLKELNENDVGKSIVLRAWYVILITIWRFPF